MNILITAYEIGSGNWYAEAWEDGGYTQTMSKRCDEKEAAISELTKWAESCKHSYRVVEHRGWLAS